MNQVDPMCDCAECTQTRALGRTSPVCIRDIAPTLAAAEQQHSPADLALHRCQLALDLYFTEAVLLELDDLGSRNQTLLRRFHMKRDWLNRQLIQLREA